MILTPFKPFSFLLILLTFPAICFAQSDSVNTEWEILKNENGISLYKKKHVSGYNSIKIETALKSTPEQINLFLLDIEHFPTWIHRCNSAKIIQTGKSKISYLITIQFPFPFLNRYVVIESTHKLNKQELIINSKSILQEQAKPDMVQIPFLSASWKAISDPSGMVNITCEMTTIPGGNIPSWLYNLFFVEAPFQTMLNLQQELLVLNSK